MASREKWSVELYIHMIFFFFKQKTAYEIMLSESQERMLLVAEVDKEKEVFEVFHKWGLDVVRVGRVTDDGFLRVRHRDKLVAEIPNGALADGAPVYERRRLPPKSTLSSRFDDHSFLDGCEPTLIEIGRASCKERV